ELQATNTPGHKERLSRCLLPLLSEISINRFDECRGSAVSRVVIQCWLGGFHLIDCHSPPHHVLNPITNDDDHVPELEDIGFVADTAVTRNYICAAFLQILRHGNVEHLVQACNETVHTTAGFRVNNRISRRQENVAGHQNIRSSEVNENVSISVTAGKVV